MKKYKSHKEEDKDFWPKSEREEMRAIVMEMQTDMDESIRMINAVSPTTFITCRFTRHSIQKKMRKFF